MSRKITAILCLLFETSVFIFAQNAQGVTSGQLDKKPYWWTLELGIKYFRDGDYGRAMISFEDARNERRAMYTRMESDWVSLLSLGEVRRLGDSLDLIETYIHERGQFDAAAALDEIYYRVKKEALNNSATTVLKHFRRLKDYPEADYWIGETYRLEGELGIASKQYNEALKYSANLADPDFAVAIKFKLAEVEQLRLNYNEMERQLGDILRQDSLWSGDEKTGDTFIRTAMARTLDSKGINNFLTLYRYKNLTTEKAHRMLGFYYYVSGRHNKAKEHLMFSALVQNTVIIDEALSKRFGYKFTTLEDLMTEISRRENLHGYMKDSEYFKTLYYLASSLYATGSADSAKGIWDFIAKERSALQWQGMARKQAAVPTIEKAIEMP